MDLMPDIEAQQDSGLRTLIPLGLGAAVPLVEVGVLRLVGINQGLYALIGAGAVLFVVAAVLAYTQLPRGWLVVALMFVGIPVGIALDAVLDFVFFDYRREYLPFETGLWLAVAAVPIPLGVCIGRALTKPDGTNGRVLLALLVFALFLAASFLAFGEFDIAAGVVLIVCGALAIAFSRSIADTQDDFASTFPSYVGLRTPRRPREIALFGVGIIVVGLSWIAFRLLGA